MCYGARVERIGVRELRNQASSVVRRARAGERLIITVDGVPAAEIGPISVADGASSVEQLIARGAVLPARVRAAPTPASPETAPSGQSSSVVLSHLRDR